MQIENFQIKNFFFQPPLAIARLGGSDKPLDCFVWDSDKSVHGGDRTVIRPAPTLKVIADGSLRPYLPNVIQFRDEELLRPVAPFFELWATLSHKEKKYTRRVAVNLEFLRTVGVRLDGVEYTITVANRKAQRRTLKASCAFIARAVVSGTDHERKSLKAYSPHNSGEEPLVSREHPIPLGHFQVINPLEQKAMGIDLSVLRVRFTPATGQVYGPRTAIAGPASPLQPGDALPPVTLGGRLHKIVPKSNRILNPNTPWSSYVMDAHDQQDPQPSDSYDGANVGGNCSWGVVDDSCDGVIEARVVINGLRHVARARVLSSCPDFAPDRRPFNSFADDLADRDRDAVTVSDDTKEQTESEIVDLFERAYETASLINLDAIRTRAVVENLPAPDESAYRSPPHVDYRSMTAGDRGRRKPHYAEITAQLFPAPSDPETPPASPPDPSVDPTPYATAAHFVHGPLCDIDMLLDTLVLEYERIERLIRPPFGRLSDLPAKQRPNRKYRDPRVGRDGFHDMRMPPYMRDSDQNSLSITYRQYAALLELMALEKAGRHGPNSKKTDTPSRRRIAQFKKRNWKQNEIGKKK